MENVCECVSGVGGVYGDRGVGSWDEPLIPALLGTYTGMGAGETQVGSGHMGQTGN